jgi:hypothetical protein
MNVRGWIAGAAALLLAAQVLRIAAVGALADTRPADAAKVWAGHPVVERQLALIGIAEAARAGKPVDQRTLASIFDASAKAPLDPDAFLVRGVQAQLEGQAGLAAIIFID